MQVRPSNCKVQSRKEAGKNLLGGEKNPAAGYKEQRNKTTGWNLCMPVKASRKRPRPKTSVAR